MESSSESIDEMSSYDSQSGFAVDNDYRLDECALNFGRFGYEVMEMAQECGFKTIAIDGVIVPSL